jgi:hypothetical protein
VTGGTSVTGQPAALSGLRRVAPTRSRPSAGLVMALLMAVVLGIALGRVTASTTDTTGAQVLEREIVPLSVDADGLWTGGTETLPPVGDQLSRLRRTPSPLTAATIAADTDGWLDAYDTVLRRMVGVEVPPPARPVQRQFVAAVTLSRDAVELIAAAVASEDPAARRDLSSEALRLRTRSEQLTQTARASLTDLSGEDATGVAEPEELPTIQELR